MTYMIKDCYGAIEWAGEGLKEAKKYLKDLSKSNPYAFFRLYKKQKNGEYKEVR